MTHILRTTTRTAVSGVLLLGALACTDKFVNVLNPNVIDAKTVDPKSGAATLANSAQQNFAVSYGWEILYSSWFSGETDNADTFPTRNEFSRRDIANNNGSLDTDLWVNISVAAASTKLVLDLALPQPTKNVNRARGAAFRGFTVLQMALDYCSGTLSVGPELSTSQMLDTAIFWFSAAVAAGNANGSDDGKALANASLVGRARAKLQKGDKAGASADAALVPAGFVFNINYTDDLGNRFRLSNLAWEFTSDRGAISVPLFYRTGDPRVPFLTPAQTSLTAFDASAGAFYPEQKYPGFGSSIRLASKLEADYIAVEAGGDPVAQLAFINAQRAANQQPAYSGATDANSVLTELMTQRGFEFYLEGKRVGDFRRNPNNILNIAATGATYFKPGFAPIGKATCFPLDKVEKDNNPNFKKP